MAQKASTTYDSLVLTPASSQTSAQPTDLVDVPGFDLSGEEAQKIVAWVKSEQSKSKNARASKVLQWSMNMAFFYGQHWVEVTGSNLAHGYANQLTVPKKPYYHDRKTINRVRSFVRNELSKFTSQSPSATVVPANAEDESVRSAYVAEQAWRSIQDAQHYDAHFARQALWMIFTGNGFIKTWWDTTCIDTMNPDQPGMIRFGSVSPFNLFVPDLREQDIEDQPFMIIAYKKTVEWCEMYYGKQLGGRSLVPSASDNSQLTDSMLNLSEGERPKDSVTLYETWIKPGTNKLLPEGGCIITIDDIMVSISQGWPYSHGQYPVTKFEHIPTSTFYADSPLVDVIPLQREYNKLRTDISEAGRRMAKPQLLAQRGSIVPSKITNEPGLVIEYKPGFQPPQPIPLTTLPEYYVNQQETILSDIEAITGQNDTAGQAPSGITAGTAINYLQEQANQFLTPEYQSIERGTERIGSQTLQLFVQYVDVPRQIRTVGADGAFDVTLLDGADIKNSTGLRVEAGSSISQSKAAGDAKVMDYFSVGIIDQPTALKMLELGGVQKFMDIMQAAQVKAQRENTKMKMLDPVMLVQQIQQQAEQYLQAPPPDASGAPQLPPQDVQQLQAELPPIVTVADFDVHEVHIETHNRFRMSAEYEALDPSVQEQFAKHVAMHQRMYMQGQMMNFLNQIPGDGSDQSAGSSSAPSASDPSSAPAGASADPTAGPGATLAGNGAAPDTAPDTSGAPIG